MALGVELQCRIFTIRNIHERVEAKGDLFAGALKKPHFDLKKVLGGLAALIQEEAA